MIVVDRPAVSTATKEAGPPAPTFPTASFVAAALGLTGVLVLALVVGGARPTVVPAGLPQPGLLVDWGLPVVRLAGRIAALGTVGTLLLAAFLLPGSGASVVRAASRWALAWAGTTVLGGVLTLSELVGVSPTSLSAATLRTFVTDVPAGRAALLVLGITGVLAVASRMPARPLAAAALLLVALAGLVVPAVLTGHSSSAADHVLAVTALSVHVVAASLWIGGLLALLMYVRGTDDRGRAVARFSVVALGCFLATAGSGLVAAWVVAGGSPAAVLGTGYGWLLIGKSAALLALGVFGWHHRRRTLARLRAGEPRSFARFAAVEVAVMLAAVALAVALSASPPPAAGGGPTASSVEDAAPPAAAASSSGPASDPMAGHDHGKLSVTVLIDATRFHVGAPVEAGRRVTVHNETTTEVTITAEDGSFDLVVPGGALTTFVAPEEAGEYAFVSRHSASYADVLVVE